MQHIAGFETGRPETGPMQFGDDWPGVFIRGDNALHFALQLNFLLDAIAKMEIQPADFLTLAALRGLAETLSSCRAR